MKLVKVVYAAVAFVAVSGSAMASTGDFRSTGEEVREGQLICQNVSASYRKQDTASRSEASAPANRQVAESSANSTSAN